VNARDHSSETPLGFAVGLSNSNPEEAGVDWLELVTLLLKRGACLDACRVATWDFQRPLSAEEVFDSARITHNWADAENVRAVKALLGGVRQHGSYKRYMRAPHREFLDCRGLAMRGYLAPKRTRRTRGDQKWKAVVAFLAKQGDNGIVWTVLSYWRATE